MREKGGKGDAHKFITFFLAHPLGENVLLTGSGAAGG